MGDLLLFLLVAGFAGVLSIGFGIVFLAPRIGRMLDRPDADEETGDRPT